MLNLIININSCITLILLKHDIFNDYFLLHWRGFHFFLLKLIKILIILVTVITITVNAADIITVVIAIIIIII